MTNHVTNPRVLSGLNCEEDINECEANPCRNDAECVDGVNMYTCNCPAGYEGVRCQIDIDECKKYNPCTNGATCSGN